MKERARLEKEIEAIRADISFIENKIYIRENGVTSARPECLLPREEQKVGVSFDEFMRRKKAGLPTRTESDPKPKFLIPECDSLSKLNVIAHSRLDSLRRVLKLHQEGPDD